ncbi:MAG: hypothetical protein JSV81_17040 [Anaerolineales bacterium]|nr:MAG: hypothetical protein JSV81_17040 [Anaerolineales bacterium]
MWQTNREFSPKMKRALFFLMPSLVLVSLVVAVLIAEARRPPGWRAELDEYLAGNATFRHGRGSVQSVDLASKPWNFGQDMGRAVFSDGTWGALELPFPPTEVWCVLLKRDLPALNGLAGESPYMVVFVSYHTDRLWNQGWVIHVGARNPFTPTFVESLSVIGCDLGLEEMKPGDIQPIVMRGA